jgi:hypothetical protein
MTELKTIIRKLIAKHKKVKKEILLKDSNGVSILRREEQSCFRKLTYRPCSKPRYHKPKALKHGKVKHLVKEGVWLEVQ